MTVIFFILISLACIILGLIVLIQNPKGGGLSGSIGGFNNQFMGVKQTTDVLEKGTWLFATIVGILCITSTMFFKGSSSSPIDKSRVPVSAPAPTQATPPNTGSFPTK